MRAGDAEMIKQTISAARVNLKVVRRAGMNRSCWSSVLW
jgi:hypothetical protein